MTDIRKINTCFKPLMIITLTKDTSDACNHSIQLTPSDSDILDDILIYLESASQDYNFLKCIYEYLSTKIGHFITTEELQEKLNYLESLSLIQSMSLSITPSHQHYKLSSQGNEYLRRCVHSTHSSS